MIKLKNNKHLKKLKQPLPYALAIISKAWEAKGHPHNPILLPISKKQDLEGCEERSLEGIKLSVDVDGKMDNGFRGFREVVVSVLKNFDNLEYTRGVLKIKQNDKV